MEEGFKMPKAKNFKAVISPGIPRKEGSKCLKLWV